MKNSSGFNGKTIVYKLSNDDYVQLNWTKKPTARKVRRVFFYETKSIKFHTDWHRGFSQQFYEDGSTFFINKAKEGKVYYSNGDFAIKLTKQEKNYDLITVFSTGGKNAFGVIKRSKIIASFDTLGNGLVLNENGGVRLSYNQIGGICIDNPGARLPLVWIWNHHKYPVMESNYPEVEAMRLMKYFPSGDEKMKKLMKTDGNSCFNDFHDSNEDFYNKTVKTDLLTAIKPICLKLNENLSFRILDRRHINLRFLCGKQTARFQLGFDVDFSKLMSSSLKDVSNDRHNFLKSRIEEQLTSPEPNPSLLSIIEEFKRINTEYFEENVK